MPNTNPAERKIIVEFTAYPDVFDPQSASGLTDVAHANLQEHLAIYIGNDVNVRPEIHKSLISRGAYDPPSRQYPAAPYDWSKEEQNVRV